MLASEELLSVPGGLRFLSMVTVLRAHVTLLRRTHVYLARDTAAGSLLMVSVLLATVYVTSSRGF